MNNRIEITGTLAFVGKVETFASGFRKRTVVLEEQRGQYADYVAFTLVKDRADLITPEMKDTRLTIGGYVKSRNWTNPQTKEVKWFTEVEAMTVRPADAQQPTLAYKYADAPKPATPTPAEAAANAEAVPDDCPF